MSGYEPTVGDLWPTQTSMPTDVAALLKSMHDDGVRRAAEIAANPQHFTKSWYQVDRTSENVVVRVWANKPTGKAAGPGRTLGRVRRDLRSRTRVVAGRPRRDADREGGCRSTSVALLTRVNDRHATPPRDTGRDGTVLDMSPSSTPPAAEPDLSPAAVAEQIGVTKSTVLELIADGRLPAYRIGSRVLRVRREDLDAFRAGDRSAARSA